MSVLRSVALNAVLASVLLGNPRTTYAASSARASGQLVVQRELSVHPALLREQSQTQTRNPDEKIADVPARRERNEEMVAHGTVALAVVTGVLAIGTIVLAVFTFRLWQATVAMAADTKAAASVQATLMQSSIAVANTSAIAAMKSANATEATVAAMHDAAERQLRAYVFPEGEGKVEIAGPTDAPRFQLRIENAGNTPASDVLVRLQRYASFFPLLDPLPELAEPIILSRQVIGPHGHIFLPSVPETLRPQEVAFHRAGGFAHYYKGDVRYVDAFGKKHITEFLLFLHGDVLAGYPEGNSWT